MSKQDLTRREFLTATGIAAANMACPSVLRTSTIEKRPNIILIVADDVGYGDLSCYRNTIVRTPHINRLAAEGVLLTQHYAAYPKCAPSRASLLTGRYSHRTGAVDVSSNRGLDRISLRETTIADVLRGAGYTTGMFGKWHNGLHDMRYHPNSRGFDEFCGFLNGAIDYYRWVLDYNGMPRSSDGRYITDVFTDEAINFINKNRAKSFFLYVSYSAPHAPFQAPKENIKKYHGIGGLTRVTKTIYAMIERMDTGIGRILDTLKLNGLFNNTMIVFTSDNGPAQYGGPRYNGGLRGSKGEVLEGGIRVPAIVRWPNKLPPKSRTKELIHFMDWFPTFLGVAGIREYDSLPLDGTDVLPNLQRSTTSIDRPRYWFWQHNRYTPIKHCNAAVRHGKWKLYWPTIPGAMKKDPDDIKDSLQNMSCAHKLKEIDRTLPQRDLPSSNPTQLFDLEADPGERHDVGGKYPEVVASMQRRWDTWFDEVMSEYHISQALNVIPSS